MIPDFFDLRNEMEEEALLYLRLRERSGPILSEVRSRTQHEGQSHSFVQSSFGVVQGMPQRFEAEVRFSLDEMTNLINEGLLAKLNSIADQMSGKLHKELFDVVARETEKAGTSIDAGGEPLTGEMVLEMMRRTEIDFDSNKRPKQKFYVHPEMARMLMDRAKEWEADAGLQDRQKQLMIDKYEAFRVRESRRKLVS